MKTNSRSRTSVAFTGHTDVSVPIDAGAAVSITAGSSTLEIALPTEVDISDGVVADDGSVRLQTIVKSPSAPSTYTYAFGGDVELTLLDDGSVEVTETIADGVTASVGLVDAPWAIDANGSAVPTHYTADDNSLTQYVDHSAQHAYSVVADPKVSKGIISATAYFNKSETKTVAQSGVTSIIGTCIAAGAAMGGVIVAGVLGAKCGVEALRMQYRANLAVNTKKCLAMKLYYGTTALSFSTYSGGNCK